MRIIGENCEVIDLKSFAVMLVSFGTTLVWHEFGVMFNLPLELLIETEILASHFCSLPYLKNNKSAIRAESKYALAAVNIATTPRSAQ